MKRIGTAVIVAGWLLLLGAAPAAGQRGAPNGEWPSYAGDPGSTKYAPLDQIDASNVAQLEIAWTWQTPDAAILEQAGRIWHGAFENTPLMIDDVLYVVTPLNLVVALRAGSGETVWTYDPESYTRQRMAPNKGFIHRGVAYWRSGEEARILHATVDAFLIALDARTGKPIPGFGDGGRVDLTEGLRKPVARDGRYGVNSAPVVVGDVVVVGSTIMDGAIRTEGIPGDVRGYDVRTGEQLWTFHTIAQEGELGAETWEGGSAEYTGNANVWAPFSADPELGIVYLPVTCATNNFYGGHRLGDNLFSQTLVAVEAKTGKRVWHFQTTHHGIWDYDLPAAPILADLEVDGEPVKAVVQLSKQGFAYVFDRATGKPVWPIEERPVPHSTVPGERTAATQPFPTKPPPFARQGIGPDDLVDFTPEIRAEALRIFEQYEHGPLYTPPSERGTLVLPGWGGGANWNGGAFDPETGLLYVPSLELVSLLQMGAPDPARSNFRYTAAGSVYLAGPYGLPLIKPPWARITALDLNRGELLWTIPHGSPWRSPDEPAPDLPAEVREKIGDELDGRKVGTAVFSPPLVTKTLLFVGIGRSTTSPEGRGLPLLQAFDKRSGEVLWEMVLPAHMTGGPMTYLSGGRQFIVAPIGGGRGAYPSSLVALALPAARPAETTASQGTSRSEGSGDGASGATEGGPEGEGGSVSVDLARVKIAELERSDEICPVHLVPSDRRSPAWTWEGVLYRGHTAECQEEFAADARGFAERARKERWVRSFMAQMSSVWCPLMTDQINPGGRRQWTYGGYLFESCCAFCDEQEPTVEDLEHAVELLRERAERSYELTGGRWVEGASSPVEGAIGGGGGRR